jgi:putative DNA primase/helicase
MWRRMLLVPFNKPVPPEKIVRHMDQAEFWVDTGEISGILNWAIVGLQRLRDQKDFTVSSVSEAAIDEYKRENNPVLDFFDDYIEVAEGGRIRIAHMFELYQHWCCQVNCRPMSLRNFGVEVKRKYGDRRTRTSSNNDRHWYYEGLTFTTSDVYGKEVTDRVYGF